jgi:hypothetical protein
MTPAMSAPGRPPGRHLPAPPADYLPVSDVYAYRVCIQRRTP